VTVEVKDVSTFETCRCRRFICIDAFAVDLWVVLGLLKEKMIESP